MPQLRRAVRRRHHCKHYEVDVMRELCSSFSRDGDRPDGRGTTYAEQYFPWWCKGLEEEADAKREEELGAGPTKPEGKAKRK